MAASSNRWSFFRAGGVDQVVLSSGADIVRLDELDPKLWVALSMPVAGVAIDRRTLELLDSDKDGHIRHPEILAAVAWVKATYKDHEQIMKGGDSVPIAALADGTVKAAALRILANLKKEAKAIALADATAGEKMFAETRFNGDGVVPVDAAEGDTRAVIEEIIKCLGAVTDRSGKPGVDKGKTDQFFTEARAFRDWQAKAHATTAPLGEATAAAADAVRAVRAKIDDYFTRCRMAAFDPRAAVALAGADADLAALSPKALSAASPELAAWPLAKIEAGRALPLGVGVNPAWAAKLATFAAVAVGPILGAGKTALTEDDWRAITGKLESYETHLAGKPQTAVEQLGGERLAAILAGSHEATIADLIAQDLAVKPEVDAMTEVERLCRYQRDLVKVLRNYANFADFYGRKGAVFQAGTLYLDSRGCALTVEVTDAGKHGAMAGMAGAYLAYCDLARAGAKKQIAAAFTAGDSDNLMVGRNGVFVDRDGKDWEATITKIVDNPISVRQAFWAPYKKLARMIEENAAKRASAAEAESHAKLEATASTVVAAIGVAIGGIGTLVAAIMSPLIGLGMWLPLGLIALMVVISSPSMFLAFMKLRNRNLGPLLDANGWAVNTRAKINVPFGGALTDVAALPAGSGRKLDDPYAEKPTPWKLYIALVVLLGLATGWYFGKLDSTLENFSQSLTSESVLGQNAPIVKARQLKPALKTAADATGKVAAAAVAAAKAAAPK
ncbi:MAG: hypothetical protein K8W52_02815 [Deltaproteobacteria bacterium]|nr:hypothetical protein [Deltaproteobacteria bacterium]